jgi:hypothetical protein
MAIIYHSKAFEDAFIVFARHLGDEASRCLICNTLSREFKSHVKRNHPELWAYCQLIGINRFSTITEDALKNFEGFRWEE